MKTIEEWAYEVSRIFEPLFTDKESKDILEVAVKEVLLSFAHERAIPEIQVPFYRTFRGTLDITIDAKTLRIVQVETKNNDWVNIRNEFDSSP